MSETRKLAAIMVADVVGYSRLARANEEQTLARFRGLRSDLIDPTIATHHGRVVKRTGDGLIVEFRSVVNAVRCAIEMQSGMVERNASFPVEQRIEFRVAIHVGDVVEEADGDLMGDGINVAARLEGIAKPGGICISDDAFRQVKSRLDLKVSDLGPQSLKNIAEPVQVYSLDADQPAKAASLEPSQAKPGPPRLSIVVLPFMHIGGDPDQDHFVDGVTESLTTDLSRMTGAFVIARNTAFTFRGKPINVREIGRQLNVRYVLAGSVQRRGERMRVNVQLVEAESSNHLWAERFDKPLTDLFEMQDEIVARLANELQVELIAAAARRSETTPNPDSMDLYFQARAILSHGVTPEILARARELCERALQMDSRNVHALVQAALVDFHAGVDYMAEDRQSLLMSAEMKITKALAAAPELARAHYVMGWVLCATNRVERGMEELERALASDANLAVAHAAKGWAKIESGRAEEAEVHILEALRLSPRDTTAYLWFYFLGRAKAYLGQFGEAAPWLRKSIDANRNWPWDFFFLAACLAHMDRIDDARREVKAGLEVLPTLTLHRLGPRSDNPVVLAQRERVIEGMRMAGLPEQ
jgi:TolB-like protein/class 3 adenylate cyclase/Tfp pilus assembly protein PilF